MLHGPLSTKDRMRGRIAAVTTYLSSRDSGAGRADGESHPFGFRSQQLFHGPVRALTFPPALESSSAAPVQYSPTVRDFTVLPALTPPTAPPLPV